MDGFGKDIRLDLGFLSHRHTVLLQMDCSLNLAHDQQLFTSTQLPFDSDGRPNHGSLGSVFGFNLGSPFVLVRLHFRIIFLPHGRLLFNNNLFSDVSGLECEKSKGTPSDKLYQIWLRGEINFITATAQMAR